MLDYFFADGPLVDPVWDQSAGGMIRNAGQTLDSKSTGGGGGSSRYTMDEVVKNGGWGLPPEAHLALDSGTLCNIPKIRAEDWAGSKGIINDEGSPVILVTANTGGAWSGSGGEDAVNANSEFLEICQRKELLRRYSETEVILSSANTFSYDKRHETLQTYLDDLLNPVTLEHYEEGEWTNFTEHYIRPQFEYDREPFFSFGIGASGSGVPFHTHGAVFAEVLYGRKRWFLTAPRDKPTYNPDATSLRWLTKVKPTLPSSHPLIYDCTLGPGEVLFIGHQWWHATLNIGQTNARFKVASARTSAAPTTGARLSLPHHNIQAMMRLQLQKPTAPPPLSYVIQWLKQR
eukprot:gene4294-17119_t